MENADIKKEEQPTKDDSFVSVEDLIMEIGKQHVDKMNTHKQIRSMKSEFEKMKVGFLERGIQGDAAKTKTIELTKSNELYMKNNERLSASLREMREENKTLKDLLEKEKEKVKKYRAGKKTSKTK